MRRGTTVAGRYEGPTASKLAIVLGIVVVIALLHVLRVGSRLRPPLSEAYYGYMFAGGVLLAAAVDRIVLSRLVSGWAPSATEGSDAVR